MSTTTILQKLELEALAEWLAEHGFAVKQPSPEKIEITIDAHAEKIG